MKKILLLLLFLSLILPLSIKARVSQTVVTNPRVNPICSSAHLNGLSQANLDKQLTLMQQAGINWVRSDFFWFDMEPTPGVYDFSHYDAIVNTAASHNIKVIILISQYGIPPWYRQNSNDWMSPPQNPQDYASFSSAIALHFKDRVQLYEIGNEPNVSLFWPPQVDVASYSALLKAAYPVIKSSDPNAKVISAGLANVDPVSFTQGMYANGVKDYFDYFGFHPYSWPRSPDDTVNAPNFAQLNEVRQVMLANGDDKLIMATEVGWPSTIQSGGVNETTQANYINRVFQKIEYEAYQFIPIACIYDFLDDGNNKSNAEFNFGLLNWQYKKKTSFTTMQNVRADYNAHFIPINP